MTTCSRSSSKHGESFPVAQVHVRKVELAGDWSPPYNIDESADLPAQNSDNPSSLIDHGTAHCRKAGVKLIPKPAFGAGSNLENLVRCSAGSSKVKVHPASDCASLARSWSTPPRSTSSLLDGDAAPAGGNNGSSTVHHSNPQRSTISHIIYSDVQLGQEAAGIVCYSSDHDNVKPVYGYEITLATSDRHGLLNFFTSALTNSTSLQLGIKVRLHATSQNPWTLSLSKSQSQLGSTISGPIHSLITVSVTMSLCLSGSSCVQHHRWNGVRGLCSGWMAH